jgi:hypothetical protein
MEAQENSQKFELPCKYLRSKEMYYQAAEDDSFASGVYWCTRTHEAFGPDGGPVAKAECCAGRTCFLC